ncbi:MAG: DMT family transporter [Rubrivivax sp.]|nr:DMT family transporter [Rubrivivax sp.]
MICSSLLFSLMGVAVKFATPLYGAGEMVMYRSLVGMALIGGLMRWRGLPLATPVPAMHAWRSATGVAAMLLWFHALGGLPLATATTLNYMSSVWIALFLIGGAVLVAPARQAIDGRLVATVLCGFAGVALVLRPTMSAEQAPHGLSALLSGVLAAMAYLQVTALGRVGEPALRVVFYFSLVGVLAGAGVTLAGGEWHGHSLRGLALLGAIGLLAAAGQWMMTRAYSHGGTLGIAALQYLGVVFAFGFGVWLFDDPVTAGALLGMVLIVGAGVAATRLRAKAQPDAVAAPES